jgi:CubicO group peptidase (beta-lactamase class C family)
MTRRKGLLGSISGVFALGCAQPGSSQPADARSGAPQAQCLPLTGRWLGELQAGPQALRLVLEVDEAGAVVLVSLDQGNARIPASSGKCEETQIDLEFASIKGRLKAVLGPADTLVGNWSQGGADRPITFTKLADGQAIVEPPVGSLAEEVSAIVSSKAAPGAIAGWSRGDRVVIEVAGVRAAGAPDLATVTDLWHIGSVTKSMTATLIARLVERGVLAWDMRLGEAFGDQITDMQAQYRDASLSELLTGRSGMSTNIGVLDIISFAGGQEGSMSDRLSWARKALALKPETERGTGFVYPNNGYVVAGALCELKTGKPWETLVREEVFQPLGLTSAGFGPPPAGNPQGHRKAFLGGRSIPAGHQQGADNPPALGPAGRVHLTLGDLLKFGRAHAAGHNGKLDQYLEAETWKRLHTPPAGSDYAYGWVDRGDGKIWHNGSNTSWLAELLVDVRQEWAAAFVINQFSNGGKALRAAAREQGI